MNARHDLGKIIWETSHHDEQSISATGANIVADAILAAGYSKPRTITTAEELDSLHAKAVILDPDGTPWVCDGDMVAPWASVCEDPAGGPIWRDSTDIALPATVIHAP